MSPRRVIAFLLSPLLAFLSALYFVGLRFDRWCKKRKAVEGAVPVISIGNLTVGGTGKTPLLLKTLFDLRQWAVRPAVLTRGYRGVGEPSSQNKVLLGRKDDVDQLSGLDEALLVKEKFPDLLMGVGSDRTGNANALAAQAKVDVFLLDDGFQHWAMNRTEDVVCVDASSPWGGGHLIPWGRLREPASALKRASLVVITRAELSTPNDMAQLKHEIGQYVPPQKILTSEFKSVIVERPSGKTLLPQDFSGKKLVALSAIGQPAAFEANVQRTGASVVPLRFRDHHIYNAADLRRIEEFLQTEKAELITTEKDVMKLTAAGWQLPFYLWQIHLTFNADDEAVWRQFLKDAVKR